MVPAGFRLLQFIIRLARKDVRIDGSKEFLKLNWFGKDGASNAPHVRKGLGLPRDRGQENDGDVPEREVVSEVREDASAIALGHHDIQ